MARKQANPTNYNKPFPIALRTLMEARSTKQKDLADHLGKTPQAISLYCNGESAPDLETLVKIADYFNVSTDYLLGINPAPERFPCAANDLGLSQACIDTLSLISRVNKDSESNPSQSGTNTDRNKLYCILTENGFSKAFFAENRVSNGEQGELLATTVFARCFLEFVENVINATIQNGNIINDYDGIPTFGEIDPPEPSKDVRLSALNAGYELLPLRDFARFKSSEIGKAIDRYLVERYIDGNY